jgi:hypothetical protein
MKACRFAHLNNRISAPLALPRTPDLGLSGGILPLWNLFKKKVRTFRPRPGLTLYEYKN